MEQLIQYLFSLNSSTGNQELVATIVIGGLIFIALISLMFFVAGVLNPVQRRLNKLRKLAHEESEHGVVKSESLARLRGKVEKLSPYFMPQKHEELSKIRVKLLQSGFRSQNAIFIYYAIKTLLAIVLPVLVFVFSPLIPDVKTESILYVAIALMGFGVFIPNAILERLKARRQESIHRAFADFLDLLVICVEAGLGLDMAIRRVANEMQVSHPVLAEELAVVSGEVNAGVDRMAALRNFSDRTGLDEIKGFVALLTQSIRFGTSIAGTLRIYSFDFRDRRTQRAEEKAAKVGTKLIFPMVFCFFPVFFVVAIGPVILKVLQVFGR